MNRSEKNSGSRILVRVRYKGEGEKETRETQVSGKCKSMVRKPEKVTGAVILSLVGDEDCHGCQPDAWVLSSM